MHITKPAYYDTFRCLAGVCPDSCCQEWDVQVDDASAAFYRSLSGPLGDRLRQVLREEDGETVMSIIQGRCPMWQEDGLCRIQAELGEAALCQTCRQFPRLTHDYGDFVELGLELSCPEAARLILTASNAQPVIQALPGGTEGDYDREAMDTLKRTRRTALSLLDLPGYSIGQRLCLLLLYGCQAQQELDLGEETPFDPQSAMETIRQFAKPGSMADIFRFFADLEILTPRWEALLRHPGQPRFPQETRNLARYFVERYWLQAVSDYDLVGRVKFILVSCLMIAALEGSFLENAQLYSKEIENSWENVEAILDSVCASPVFTDDRLLGLLLKT